MALTFPHAEPAPRAEPLLGSLADWARRRGSRHLRLAEPDRVDVVLVTEGTYPFARGGVSVWCDQVVSGLPELSFRVAAVTAFRHQQVTYQLPEHVRELRRVGLWDGTPRYRGSGHAPVPDLARRLAALLAAPGDDVAGFRAFVDALVDRAGGGQAGPAGVTGPAAHLGFGELLRALDEEVVRTPRWWALEGVRVADLVQVAEMLDHLLRTVTFDTGPAAVYHAVSNGLAALACMVATRRHGGTFLLSEHGVYLRERYLELRRLPLARPAKALLVRFHRLVSAAAYAEASVTSPCSDWNQRWERRFGARPTRIRTVYNGIDPRRFPARATDADDPGPVVAWLGRIDPLKDLETLVRAFRIVCDKRPEARLRLFGLTPAGNEDYRARLDRLIDELDLGEAVTFPGKVAHGSVAYAQARICVLSSISEGFPYALIEAMACGLPSVATGVGGVPEALAKGTGLVVLPRAPEQLGSALLELLDDPERCARMGALARQRVLDEFTLDRCLDAYRSLYRQLAEEAARERSRRCGLPRADGVRRSGAGGGARTGGTGGARTGGTGGGGARAADREPDASFVVPVLGLRSRFDAGRRTGGTPSGPVDASGRRALDPLDYDALVAAVGGLDALRAAVDVEEVVATLESVGVTDQVAIQRFASSDVFDLAERVWAQSALPVPPAPAGAAGGASDRPGSRDRGDGGGGGGGVGGRGGGGQGPPPRPEPVLPSARGALARGVAYVVPAVVVAAATLQGEAQVALVAASVLGWGLAQGGGALAYTVLNRSPAGSGLRPLRRAFVASTAVILAAGLAIGGTATPAAGTAFALPLLYLVASCGLIMAGRTWRLLALLTPTTGLSIAALARPGLELAPLVFPSAAATVAVALLLVVQEAGGFGGSRRGRDEGVEPARRPRLLFAGDWLAAVPMVACGLASAGCAVLSVRALARVDGLVGAPDRVWLLLALPLWAMVVGNEWLLMRMRRSLRALLHTSVTVAGFRGEGLWIVTGWLAGGAAILAGTVLVAMAVAGLPVLAAWQVSSVFLHVSLAFVGVTVLYTAPRVVPALLTLGATLVTLAGVVLTPWAPLGLADHTLALVTCAAAAAVLCATAARTLTDPAVHR